MVVTAVVSDAGLRPSATKRARKPCPSCQHVMAVGTRDAGQVNLFRRRWRKRVDDVNHHRAPYVLALTHATMVGTEGYMIL